jgi:hypothetical protein
MFKGFDEREIIKIFSIFGGTPYYLTLVNKAKNLEKNIFELFIKKVPFYMKKLKGYFLTN